jgi:mannose-1-phosphate guanylyltransferase
VIQPVILCGGSGTRLWPLSREHHPKPLHAVNGERTLLQETALRCDGEPLVVCNEAHRFLVQEQLRRAGCRPKAIILESKGRGTAPALTLAAIHARRLPARAGARRRARGQGPHRRLRRAAHVAGYRVRIHSGRRRVSRTVR